MQFTLSCEYVGETLIFEVSNLVNLIYLFVLLLFETLKTVGQRPGHSFEVFIQTYFSQNLHSISSEISINPSRN